MVQDPIEIIILSFLLTCYIRHNNTIHWNWPRNLINCFRSISHHFQITTKLNPDCPDSVCYNESITLIHTTADGPNDSIHHIWDFTGPPSILIALTEPNASVTIDWGSFMDDAIDAIQISPTPIYSAALVLTKVSLFFCIFMNSRACVCVGWSRWRKGE